ncbi:MAG: adenylosuccinate lyase [Rickettsiales bacterium]|nr:adenylosuccinate lyase [Rickettsiales bacterium]OUV83103.1 MAG: adenylosuccinate lyase [Rickettsiales bacterium TMED131]|tara:strand:+ start:2817 stop:4130 length:1314 start_codon:yes stop_codon:yes gene_type:complete
MIPRYSTPDMESIWSTENKYSIWLEIEILACEAMEKSKKIPKGTSKKIRSKANFDVNRILEIEKKTKHDVIAFLTNVAEYVGSSSKFIHQGMTSSDVLDTCLSVQLKNASTVLIKNLKLVLNSLKQKSLENKELITIGRSHGIHAEPTTMGLKFAYAYAEFKRSLKRLEIAKKEISICKISGPVGTYSSISPEVENYVAKKLGLVSEDSSTQIIPRDRHASFFSTLSILASSIDRLATEIRHLQRTEVLEVEESFEKGQKGSSAMPHKRNPVLSENLSGISRYIRNLCHTSLENIVLWHERDISHSSAERIMCPDITIALDFSLKRLNNVIENLIIYPKNIKYNLDKLRGLHFSQNVMLALINKGLLREEAYSIVQNNAMKTWRDVNNKSGNSFYFNLSKDKKVTELISKKELKKLFNNNTYLKNISVIYNKVFKKK